MVHEWGLAGKPHRRGHQMTPEAEINNLDLEDTASDHETGRGADGRDAMADGWLT